MELIHTLLLQAIEGESAAEARYRSFSVKARQDGFTGVASLFLALSRAEAIHTANHTRALRKNGYQSALPKTVEDNSPGTTLNNVERAIRAEYEEFHTMYPSFYRQIQKKHGSEFEAKIALLSIKWASESESNHHALLKEARRKVAAGIDMTEGELYLCSVCGNLHYLQAPPVDLCRVCGHDLSFYTLCRVEK